VNAPRDAIDLLRDTRRLTIAVTVLLTVQLSGNVYEELVTNVRTYAEPRPASVGELEAGSPLFFYLPWVPLGLVLAVVLVVRLHRLAPPSVARRGRWALASIAVAVTAKAYLIAQVNPEFRRTDIPLDEVRDNAVVWGIVNGMAIIAIAVAMTLLLSWRPRMLEDDVISTRSRRPRDSALTPTLGRSDPTMS
jgi:hypothetical protein